jgi:hypothetical protein
MVTCGRGTPTDERVELDATNMRIDRLYAAPAQHRAGYRVVRSAADSVNGMTVSISVTLDDDLSEELNAAVAGSNRSAMVAEAIRDYLDRRAVAAAAAWHSSLTGEDAATFADFNAAW